ncbi:hypothetical protein [Candidatus Frankia alpina]|uniref:Uncharacterized protein n=1 Tax=Candidatus Frankia alpina TaxID=2699483 RepID=A0A4S5CW68_9ACTN|nr:hypothetical protein [Candidatus Frankia alpina]THJ48088.1 hypothetical protein E7Y31_19455 [Candidatus Frankia alpina]
MKYVKLFSIVSLAFGAALAPVAVPASAADLTKAVVNSVTTFQCSDGCSLPGVINVDPQTVVGPDASDPTLRVGRWPRTVYISCFFDATSDGTKYLVYVDDRGWTGQWWIAKENLQHAINEQSIRRCRGLL